MIAIMIIDLPFFNPEIDEFFKGDDNAGGNSSLIGFGNLGKADPFSRNDTQEAHPMPCNGPVSERRQGCGEDISSITVSEFVKRGVSECIIKLSVHRRMKHYRFFGKVFVKCSLGYPRLLGDIVNTGTCVPISKENDRRAFTH